MNLYFARHGESEANIEKTFSNRDLPHHLTAKGIEHAAELAALLRDLRIGELWSSPVPRTVETAKIVGSSLRLPYSVTEALREFDVGRYEGTNSAEGWAEYASVTRSWLEGDHARRVGGGESLSEIVARLGEFLSGFASAASDDKVAFIGHGGLYRVALPHVFANVSPHFAAEHTVGYGSLIVAKAKDGRIICTSWNGISLSQRGYQER